MTGFWHSTLALAIGIAILLLALFTTALFSAWHFINRRGIAPTREWLHDFDLTRYKALVELFDPRDFEFLRSQPGYTPELVARLKADRLKIAQGYLRELESDVRLLLNFANHSSGIAGSASSDISGFLLQQELKFVATMFLLRAQLALLRFGLVKRIKFGDLLESLRPLVQHSQALAFLA